MTAPVMLHVPIPTLSLPPGNASPLEKPVAISFDEVRFPDGSAMIAEDYIGAVAVIARLTSPASPPQVWDSTSRTWVPLAGADLHLMGGVPLVPPPEGGAPWKGLLIAAAQTDAGGAPQFSAATAHFPRYTVRGAFRAERRKGKDTAVARGIGNEGAPIEFVATDRIIEVDASSGVPVVTVVNRTAGGPPLARVRLESDGGITLLPSAGRAVLIQGDLEAERVRYQPALGGPKLVL